MIEEIFRESHGRYERDGFSLCSKCKLQGELQKRVVIYNSLYISKGWTEADTSLIALVEGRMA